MGELKGNSRKRRRN